MVKMSLQPLQLLAAELPEQLPANCSSNGACKGSWEDADTSDRATHLGPQGPLRAPGPQGPLRALGPQATMPTDVSLMIPSLTSGRFPFPSSCSVDFHLKTDPESSGFHPNITFM